MSMRCSHFIIIQSIIISRYKKPQVHLPNPTGDNTLLHQDFWKFRIIYLYLLGAGGAVCFIKNPNGVNPGCIHLEGTAGLSHYLLPVFSPAIEACGCRRCRPQSYFPTT